MWWKASDLTQDKYWAQYSHQKEVSKLAKTMERINAQNDKSCYMIISTFKQLCTYAGWARHFEPWGWWLHLGCSVIGFNKKKNMLYWQVIQRRAWRSHAGRQHWASHRITASAVRISAPQAAWSYAAHPRPPCDALVYSPTQTHIVILIFCVILMSLIEVSMTIWNRPVPSWLFAGDPRVPVEPSARPPSVEPCPAAPCWLLCTCPRVTSTLSAHSLLFCKYGTHI